MGPNVPCPVRASDWLLVITGDSSSMSHLPPFANRQPPSVDRQRLSVKCPQLALLANHRQLSDALQDSFTGWLEFPQCISRMAINVRGGRGGAFASLRGHVECLGGAVAGVTEWPKGSQSLVVGMPG